MAGGIGSASALGSEAVDKEFEFVRVWLIVLMWKYRRLVKDILWTCAQFVQFDVRLSCSYSVKIIG